MFSLCPLLLTGTPLLLLVPRGYHTSHVAAPVLYNTFPGISPVLDDTFPLLDNTLPHVAGALSLITGALPDPTRWSYSSLLG